MTRSSTDAIEFRRPGKRFVVADLNGGPVPWAQRHGEIPGKFISHHKFLAAKVALASL